MKLAWTLLGLELAVITVVTGQRPEYAPLAAAAFLGGLYCVWKIGDSRGR